MGNAEILYYRALGRVVGLLLEEAGYASFKVYGDVKSNDYREISGASNILNVGRLETGKPILAPVRSKPLAQCRPAAIKLCKVLSQRPGTATSYQVATPKHDA